MAKTIKVTIEEEEPKKSQGKKGTKTRPKEPLLCGYCGGKGKIVEWMIDKICPICKGMGRRPFKGIKCAACEGKGKSTEWMVDKICPACKGWGYIKQR